MIPTEGVMGKSMALFLARETAPQTCVLFSLASPELHNMAELIWDGKYDEHGNKRAPVRIELPFQTVETVNESVQERQRTLELSSSGHDPEWRNRLIWGDKKYVLPSLLPEFAGKVDLIYIDPPFDTGADFSFTATVAHHADATDDDSLTFTKEPSIIEHKAYRDTWGRGLDSYVQWFYETATLLRELLREAGSLYVHLDYHVSHYAKAVLDEVFGSDNFKNEIIWKRQTAHSDSHSYANLHDVIFLYTKSAAYTFNTQYLPYTEKHIAENYRYTDENGTFALGQMKAPGNRGPRYSWNGIERHWRYTKVNMQKLHDEGRLCSAPL